jgi:AcrR family transcriptional regulator
MKVGSRGGSEGDKTRAAILDAAEAIMREDGYAAVSSRRVAERANLRPSLLHYHFGSMEDLFLALNRRASDVFFDRHLEALSSAEPLRSLWEFLTDTSGAKLVFELIALASHQESLREEIKRAGERTRKIEMAFISKLFDDLGVDQDEYPPAVISFLMAGAARAFVSEATIGITTGHAEMLAFMGRRLQDVRRMTGGEQAAGAPQAPGI